MHPTNAPVGNPRHSPLPDGRGSDQPFGASTIFALFAKQFLGVEFLYENDGFAQRVAFV